ncbi:myosin-7 [Plakobranchus ocellatus]|uniref:Myosin-7 n=1 Tax=Plakobranchus ocellatus TaxID=259542 RepID=A0AAV3ZZ47_9GAST|nr:myosin-7 [Plakobranchus ocellatus]
MNHFQTVCHSKFRKKSVNDLDLELEDEIEIETLMIDSVIDDKEEQGWTTNLKIGCTELKFKIDTGADISIISKKAYDLIEKKPALEAC